MPAPGAPPDDNTANTDDLMMASVTPSYVHYDKLIEPGNPLILPAAVMKWYDLAHPETPVPSGIGLLARSFLEREAAVGALKDAGNLGFVIMHRCGAEFYFLLVSTWRNANELWESVYAMDGATQSDFQLFPFSGSHRGTFCVWELAAVWHEQGAWKRYLLSARDEGAKSIYLQDLYHSPA